MSPAAKLSRPGEDAIGIDGWICADRLRIISLDHLPKRIVRQMIDQRGFAVRTAVVVRISELGNIGHGLLIVLQQPENTAVRRLVTEHLIQFRPVREPMFHREIVRFIEHLNHFAKAAVLDVALSPSFVTAKRKELLSKPVAILRHSKTC